MGKAARMRASRRVPDLRPSIVVVDPRERIVDALERYGQEMQVADAARRQAERAARERVVDVVAAALAAGLSWGDVGKVLGVSKQAAHERWARR